MYDRIIIIHDQLAFTVRDTLAHWHVNSPDIEIVINSLHNYEDIEAGDRTGYSQIKRHVNES